MRIVTLITATAVMAYWAGNPHFVSWKASQVAEEEKRAAIELSCGDVAAWLQPDCEEDLAADFSSGATTPRSILRLHCTHVESVWQMKVSEARPELCDQLPEAALSS